MIMMTSATTMAKMMIRVAGMIMTKSKMIKQVLGTEKK
jgi:hypothetical protein